MSSPSATIDIPVISLSALTQLSHTSPIHYNQQPTNDILSIGALIFQSLRDHGAFFITDTGLSQASVDATMVALIRFFKADLSTKKECMINDGTKTTIMMESEVVGEREEVSINDKDRDFVQKENRWNNKGSSVSTTASSQASFPFEDPRGYRPKGQLKTDANEKYSIGSTQNLWPLSTGPHADVQSTLQLYFEHVDSIAHKLVKILVTMYMNSCVSPSIDTTTTATSETNSKITEPPSPFHTFHSTLRSIYYTHHQNDVTDVTDNGLGENQVSLCPSPYRFPPHTDSGILTVISNFDEYSSLQIRDATTGEWVAIGMESLVESSESSPAVFFCHLGDTFSHWTSGIWKSTIHRVVHGPCHPSSIIQRSYIESPRLSIAFFLKVSHDQLLTPHPYPPLNQNHGLNFNIKNTMVMSFRDLLSRKMHIFQQYCRLLQEVWDENNRKYEDMADTSCLSLTPPGSTLALCQIDSPSPFEVRRCLIVPHHWLDTISPPIDEHYMYYQ